MTLYLPIPYSFYIQSLATDVSPHELYRGEVQIVLTELGLTSAFSFRQANDHCLCLESALPQTKPINKLKEKFPLATEEPEKAKHTGQLLQSLAFNRGLEHLDETETLLSERVKFSASTLRTTALADVFTPPSSFRLPLSGPRKRPTLPSPSTRTQLNSYSYIKRALKTLIGFACQTFPFAPPHAETLLPEAFQSFLSSLNQILLSHPIYTSNWPHLAHLARYLDTLNSFFSNATTYQELLTFVENLPPLLPDNQAGMIAKLDLADSIIHKPVAPEEKKEEELVSSTQDSLAGQARLLAELQQALDSECEVPFYNYVLLARATHCTRLVLDVLFTHGIEIESILPATLEANLHSDRPLAYFILSTLTQDMLLQAKQSHLPTYIKALANRESERRHTGYINTFTQAARAFTIMLATLAQAAHDAPHHYWQTFAELRASIKDFGLLEPTFHSVQKHSLIGVLAHLTCQGYAALKGPTFDLHITLPCDRFIPRLFFQGAPQTPFSPVGLSPLTAFTSNQSPHTTHPSLASPRQPDSTLPAPYPTSMTRDAPYQLPWLEAAPQLEVTTPNSPFENDGLSPVNALPKKMTPDAQYLLLLTNPQCALAIEGDSHVIGAGRKTYSISVIQQALAFIESIRAFCQRPHTSKTRPFWKDVILPFIDHILPRQKGGYDISADFSFQDLLALANTLQDALPASLHQAANPLATTLLKELKPELPPSRVSAFQSASFTQPASRYNVLSRALARLATKHNPDPGAYFLLAPLEEANSINAIFTAQVLAMMATQSILRLPQNHIKSGLVSGHLNALTTGIKKWHKLPSELKALTGEARFFAYLLYASPQGLGKTFYRQFDPNWKQEKATQFYAAHRPDLEKALLAYFHLFPLSSASIATQLGLPGLANVIVHFYALNATQDALARHSSLEETTQETLKADIASALRKSQIMAEPFKDTHESKATDVPTTFRAPWKTVAKPMQDALTKATRQFIEDDPKLHQTLCQKLHVGRLFYSEIPFNARLLMAIDQNRLLPASEICTSKTIGYFLRHPGFARWAPEVTELLKQLDQTQDLAFLRRVEYCVELAICAHFNQNTQRRVTPRPPENEAEQYLQALAHNDPSGAPRFETARRACRSKAWPQGKTETALRLVGLVGLLHTLLPKSLQSRKKVADWLKLKRLVPSSTSGQTVSGNARTLLLQLTHSAYHIPDEQAASEKIKEAMTCAFPDQETPNFLSGDELLPYLEKGLKKTQGTATLWPERVMFYRLVTTCLAPQNSSLLSSWFLQLDTALQATLLSPASPSSSSTSLPGSPQTQIRQTPSRLSRPIEAILRGTAERSPEPQKESKGAECV